jgi:hypothetical protein
MGFVADAPAAPAKKGFVPDAPEAPKPRSFLGDVGHTLLGEGEIAGTAVGNIIPAAINSANNILNQIYRTPGAKDNPLPTFHVGQAGKDLVKTVGGFMPGTANGLNVSDQELRDNLDPGGTRPIEELRAEYQKESDKPLTQVLHENGNVGSDLLANAITTGGDVANILPLAGGLKSGARAIASAGEEAPVATIDDALSAVGYRNLPRQGEGSGSAKLGAKIVGEQPLAQHQTLTNQAVTDTLAKHEAGVPQAEELNYDNTAKARAAGPGKVYNSAEAAMPDTMVHDPELQSAIAGVSDTTSQLPKSPDVEALKQAMIAQPTMTRTELFKNIQVARDRASRFFASDAPGAHDIGDAYQGIANAYEDFVGRQLAANPDAGVTLGQWQDARTAFAKNYAVQSSIRGTSADASKLAALQRKDPERLTGGLRLIAEQNNRYPLSTGFGPTTFEAGGIGASGTPQGIVARHVTGPVLGGAVGSLFGQPAVGAGAGLLASEGLQNVLRRVLGGNPEKAASIAGQAVTDPRLGSFFDQLSESGPQYDRLPPHPEPSGPLSLADELGAGGHPQGPGSGIPLADVLSHGVEKPPVAGPTAGPMGAPPAEGIPFARNADHEAGGLDLMSLLERAALENNSDLAAVQSARLPDRTIGAERTLPKESPTPGSGSLDLPTRPGLSSDELSIQHEPTLMELLENLRDHPSVMSQGVPEDIMTRTANNASGESSASLEAINRTRREQASGQDRFLIDPDGKMWPVRGVEAADATAPKGSIIVQKGVGGSPYTILDRGGLPRAHANGLLNRALAGGHGMTLMDLLEGGGA